MKRVSLFAAVVLATSAVPAAAQLPGIGVRLVPKAGLYKPAGDIVDGYKIKNHLAIGLAAELKLPVIPFGIRANIDYTGNSDIEDDAGARAGTVALTNIAGDLMFRPLPGIIPVQPYLFAGGGVKKYKFRDFDTATFDSGENRTDPTLHVGAGVGVGIGLMSVVIEGGDYLSRFKFGGESKLQNDLYGTVGIKVGLF